MVRTPKSVAEDFAESSLFTGRLSILALAACGVGFSLSGRLPAAIFSLAAAAVAAAARLWARHVLDGVTAALQAERSCVFPGESCPLRVTVQVVVIMARSFSAALPLLDSCTNRRVPEISTMVRIITTVRQSKSSGVLPNREK